MFASWISDISPPTISYDGNDGRGYVLLSVLVEWSELLLARPINANAPPRMVAPDNTDAVPAPIKLGHLSGWLRRKSGSVQLVCDTDGDKNGRALAGNIAYAPIIQTRTECTNFIFVY